MSECRFFPGSKECGTHRQSDPALGYSAALCFRAAAVLRAHVAHLERTLAIKTSKENQHHQQARDAEARVRELEEWRAETTRLAVQVEDLEHEVGTLREQLRRIKGYVNSVVTGGVPEEESGGVQSGESVADGN